MESYLWWRWTKYITGIIGALALVLDVLFLEETYVKTILQRRAANIRKETGNFAIHHISEEEIRNHHIQESSGKALAHSYRLLFLEPSKSALLQLRNSLLIKGTVVFLIAIYTAFIYRILYLFLEAYPIVFAQYQGINTAVATLPYIGLIIGVLIGCGIVIFFEPRCNQKLKENNGLPVPEQRLLPMVGAVLFPIGLFWFAWTGNYSSIHWIVPTLSGLLTGARIMTIFLEALNYLIDAYLIVAASAIAANTLLGSLFGAGFLLFATVMFDNLGVNWPDSLLEFLAVAILRIPF